MAYQFKTSFGAAGLAAGSTQMDLPRRLTNEISGTGDIDLFQVLRKGDYLYGVDNNVFTLGTKITEITDLTAKVRIKFNKPTAAAVANENIDMYFQRFFNTTNDAIIGFDRDRPQAIQTEAPLFDNFTFEPLVDASGNQLVTDTSVVFLDTILSKNSTSIVANAEIENKLTVEEQFPNTSEVSTSLLGVPRAEVQLSLFSDVSTLGFDESNWEVYRNFNRRDIRPEWEERATLDGSKHFNVLMRENILEQALELSGFPVPYIYPYGPFEDDGFKYNPRQYKLFANFIRLGNYLYNIFNNDDEGFGSDFKNSFLDPSLVRVEEEVFTEEDISGQFGVNVKSEFVLKYTTSEAAAFRLIDIWTENWIRIESSIFDIGLEKVYSIMFPNPNTTEGRRYINVQTAIESSGNLLANSGFNKKFSDGIDGIFQLVEDDVRLGTLIDFSKPGYDYPTNEEKDTVRLQTKETYRYQPGRVSGFTFGARSKIDRQSADTHVEWGITNPTDTYAFRQAGTQLSIVRRSTIPLSDDILFDSQLPNSQVYKTGQVDKFTDEALKDFYELVIPRDKWNNDPLNGTGPSGYQVNPEQVTMWKIEFSWYGAVGAKFYAYVPIDNDEARWVLIHTIVIENKLELPCLEDAYFKMYYELEIGDRSRALTPQFVYKYGSSVYIDGGDEGTKKQYSYVANEKIFGATSGSAANDNNNRIPLIGLRPRSTLANRQGVERENRLIAYPELLNVAATEDSNKGIVSFQMVECEACPEFGYTYDNGLRSRTILGNYDSPSKLDKTFDFHIVDESGGTLDGKQYIELSTRENAHKNNFYNDSGSMNNSPDNFFTFEDDDAKIICPGFHLLYVDMKATFDDYELVKATEAAKFGHENNDTFTLSNFTSKRVRLKSVTKRRVNAETGAVNYIPREKEKFFVPGSKGLGTFVELDEISVVGTDSDGNVRKTQINASAGAAVSPFTTYNNVDLVDRIFFDGSDANGYREYTYLIGRPAFLSKMDALATANVPINGTTNDLRFLNITPRVSSAWGRQGAEFRIGFTDKKPNIDASGEFVGFDYGAGAGDTSSLNDDDYLFADWTYSFVNSGSSGAQKMNGGEYDSVSLAKFQLDYRIKEIPNDNPVSGEPSNGGKCSKVTLEVSDVKSFGGLIYLTEILDNGAIANTPIQSHDILTRYGNGSNSTIEDLDFETTANYLIILNSSFNDFIRKDTEEVIDLTTDVPPTKNVIFKNGEVGLDSTLQSDGSGNNIKFLTDAKHFVYQDSTGADASGYIFKISPIGSNTNFSSIRFQDNDDDLDGQISETEDSTKLNFTLVNILFTENGKGVIRASESKVFKFNPYPLYPVVKMRDGSVINSLSIKQKTANDIVVTSPQWALSNGASIFYPLGPTHEDTIQNIPNELDATDARNAVQSNTEKFESIDKLSSLEVDRVSNKRLRRIFDPSDTKFNASYTDGSNLKTIRADGNRITATSKRGKLLSTFFAGGDTSLSINVDRYNLEGIFGEDRAKVMPDVRGSKAIYIVGRQLDESGEITLQATVNTTEI
jgi:hypothetical protein